MRSTLTAAALSLCLCAGAIAQPVTPSERGGPQPGRADTIGRDAGPSSQPPRTDSPDAVNRGTDGSAAGHDQPGATGITPQGMMGTATAGSRDPDRPVPPPPPVPAPPSR